MRKAVVVVLVLAAGGWLTLAQEKPPAVKPPEEQIGGLRFVDVSEVTIKNVDVSVTDRDGRPVTHLRREDFLVFQNGEPQEVVNFAIYQGDTVVRLPDVVLEPEGPGAAPAPTPTPRVEERREPRFLVLLIDNENITVFNRNRVINRMAEWVRETLKPPDQMMVVSYQRSLKVLQPLTSDPEDIASALRTMRTFVGARAEVNSSRRDIEDFIAQDNNKVNLDRALSQVRAFAREQRNNLTFTVRALQDFVAQMSGLPGKRAIVYVSDGLPMSPGLELFYEIQEQYRDPGSLSQSREFDATTMFRSLVTSCASAGVTLYTIDARGLQSELGIEAENRQSRSTLSAAMTRSNYQDSLLYMADQTGGLAIVNTNDVGPGLKRIYDDFSTYYSLGYRLVPTGTDRLHRIEVKLKGYPEYRLNYTRTFIEKTLPTRIADRVMTGLTFPVEENPLGIAVIAGEAAPASGSRYTLPVEVRIPLANVALIPDGDGLSGYVMVYYAARDDDGKQSDLQRLSHTIRVKQAEYEKARGQYYTVSASLLLEPGRYRISVGLRDELTNQASFASLRREVGSVSAR